MSEFAVSSLPQGAIQYLYSLREEILLDPPYQRASDIWTVDKRQLLVDSVINGYDIPKFYFHELVPAKKIGRVLQRYAIIDGKQRLSALWDFMEGKFALAPDFQYLHDSNVKAANFTYGDLGKKYPILKSRFDATTLAVVAVRTDDIDLIEDMFSRLNEAVPLNAPEKRNAFPGPIPKVIRDLAAHELFSNKLAFIDRRYKHRDLATKFLMIEDKDEVVDTKKTYLDSFVMDWAEKPKGLLLAAKLQKRVEVHLEKMCHVFTDNDTLLKSVGMATLMFHLYRLLSKIGAVGKVRRDHFVAFETARQENRELAATDIRKASYSLLEFDKYIQTPNDAYATRIRLAVLANFINGKAGLEIPESHPYLSLALAKK
ncbi:MAG: DUF262 domain-containing protein [Planctomycetota bacterium]|nr:DUF262 domain-containing protein [Planctomycetota bacterium]